MGNERSRLAVISWAVAIAVVAGALVLPGVFGQRAERTYRDALGQLSGLRLDSYQRGWFSSRVTISFPFAARRVTIAQVVHHGPIAFYDGWHVTGPVAAVVETDTAQAQTALNRLLGEAALRVTTTVAMNSGLDTFISRAESSRGDPATGSYVGVGGFRLEWLRSQQSDWLNGAIPSVWIRNRLGSVELINLSTRGVSREQEPLLRVGNSEFHADRIAFNPSGSRASFALQDVAVNYGISLTGGMLDLQWKFSVGQFTNPTQSIGPITLTMDLSHIAAPVVQDFVRQYRVAGEAATSNPQSMNHAFAQLALQLVKQAPVWKFGLAVKAPDGALAGEARMGLDPALVNDPQITAPGPDHRAMIAYARRHYGWASARLSAPVAMLSRLMDANKLQHLEDCHYLVREGGNEIAHATFKDGGLILNGNKVALPSPPPPASYPGPPAT